jgi:GT2 family glycosyltransferase/SAM-dependent methyltransferase
MPKVQPDGSSGNPAGTIGERAGAPRLIEWTGERCVPWAPDIQVVYEHFHRYLWASGLVEGRRVLDLASGEGFGAAILARSAHSVVGVDIDEPSVEHSRLNYAAPNLRFELADARDLSKFPDDSFDAVIAFEMIEHIEEQDHVLEEVRRVLAPGGLLIISTPDRDFYDELNPKNPFHVRELGREGFRELLRSTFGNVALFGQRTITGSAMAALDGSASASASTFVIQRDGDAWQTLPELPALYMVAVASDAALPEIASMSTLGDPGIELLREAEETLANRQAAFAETEATLRRELAQRRAQAASDAHTIAGLDAQLSELRRQYLRIQGSVIWQLFQRVRRIAFAALGGERSSAIRALQSTLRMIGRRLRLTGAPDRDQTRLPSRRRRQRTPGPIVLPTAEHPDVSIVIPIHAHAELTAAALESIRDNTAQTSYEVILVEDAADERTKALLEHVRGAEILVNENNLGYRRSVARGAGAARGRWLVLANNDIEVQPGWLAAMLDCGESRPDIAVVAPKFVSPDGLLSEAGGIVWRDGTAANYGRCEDPVVCHYEYRREIDYGSAAALMVKADLWREVGGFDERFDPMYYEDTDLCFEARARGLRVMYEPRAHVIHVEGATAGVDEQKGHKRHQERNRPLFLEKWRERLAAEHLAPDRSCVWRAANLRRSPHVLVVDHRVPMWDRDSGALRMRGIIQAMIDLGAHVTFLPDNGAPVQPYTRELQRLGVEVLYGVDFEAALAMIGPSLSLAVLSRPQTAGRWVEVVKKHAPLAKLVYDTVDLHWLREARGTAAQSGSKGDGIALSSRASAMRELELSLIRTTDATVVVSEAERGHVLADVPDAETYVLPNVNEIWTRVPAARDRRGLLFVGGFEHPPNVDAALALIRDVMPLVWQELGEVATVAIAGADPPPEVRELESPLVNVLGWVNDLDPLLASSRALVAPLRFGAGLKGKVTQALAAGLPVITTPIGAEGLDAVDGEHMLIGDSSAELAKDVVRILTDSELWQRLSQAGQQLASERCSPELMTERIGELIGDAVRIPISA